MYTSQTLAHAMSGKFIYLTNFLCTKPQILPVKMYLVSALHALFILGHMTIVCFQLETLDRTGFISSNGGISANVSIKI